MTAPTGDRRRALAGPSARSLLMTVFGNNVLPRGGSVWTGTAIAALAALGVEEKTARQALARTAADGWLRRERHGRRVRWTFTPAGHELFTRGAERIFSFGRVTQEWDGWWLVLFTSVPEARRARRHRLRTRLAWAGFGSPAPGVWLTPDPTREAEAKEVLAELGLDGQASSFIARYGAIGDQPAIVAAAWDVPALRARYDAFLAEFARVAPRTPEASFVAHTRLVDRWRHFPFVDPGLPAGLLPAGWSGTRAAELFHERNATWHDAAQAWFDATVDRHAEESR
jgi:phenylacetic acid degradation operon negative regulatory protein